MSLEVPPAIPPHLRGYVVEQNYDAYTAEDQAVWRFVLLQTHERLLETAHDSYERGFAAAGISVDAIPRIHEMSERLARFGWRAVAVDGFIPPRAFQAFQARGILPVAADIRTSRHLTYTPAPDVIHEAAGHAPFLMVPEFARYVRRIGDIAERTFANPADRLVYDAIALLSEIKEDPASTASQIVHAEAAVAEAHANVTTLSEGARLARLYWWTAEYGLVGTPSDYRLYGAGLLSSIGEGHFCRHPSVRKLPLTADCVDVDYDITRAQPQLFVARSFAQLEEVLATVDAGLSYRVGGRVALRAAEESGELATLSLDSGVEVAGVVARLHDADGALFGIELRGPCALGEGGVVLDGLPRHDGYFLPLGRLLDGTPLSALTLDALSRLAPRETLTLSLDSGVTIRGPLRGVVPVRDVLGAALLGRIEITRGDALLFRSERPFPLALGGAVTTAWAGAPRGYFSPEEPSGRTVPRPRQRDAAQADLVVKYEQLHAAALALGGRELEQVFARMLGELERSQPDDWLVRWNLLEALVQRGAEGELASRLEASLERLELRFEHLEPIATGLAYLRALSGKRPGPSARAG